jgi:hypothetical protein
MSERARPRAQQLASFKPWNISPPLAHTTLGCGRDGRTPLTQKLDFGVRVYVTLNAGAYQLRFLSLSE